MSQDQNLFSKISPSVLNLTLKKDLRRVHTSSECIDCYFNLADKLTCDFCKNAAFCALCGSTRGTNMPTQCPDRILNAWELKNLEAKTIDFDNGKWKILGKEENFAKGELVIPDGYQATLLTTLVHLSDLYNNRSSSDPDLVYALQAFQKRIYANTLVWAMLMSEFLAEDNEEF